MGGGSPEGTSYWGRWGFSAVELLSLDGLLSSLGLRDRALEAEDATEGEKREGLQREDVLRRRLRICSSLVMFLATGYVLGNLIFRGPSSFTCPSGTLLNASSPSASSSSSSCIIEGLKRSGSDHLAYSLLLSSPSPPLPTAFNSSSSAALGHSASPIRIQPASLAQLIDFNAVAAGKEGFIVQIRNHIDLLLRWKDFGTRFVSSLLCSLYSIFSLFLSAK
jgi:hypothetical protein